MLNILLLLKTWFSKAKSFLGFHQIDPIHDKSVSLDTTRNS